MMPFRSAMFAASLAGALPTSAVWTLVEARNCTSSPAANQDFVNLGGYDELIVVLDGVTCSGASDRYMRFSTDNGATFPSSGADYQSYSGTGAVTNRNEIYISGAGAGAQYGFMHVPSLTGRHKMALSTSPFFGQHAFVGSAARVNAVRVHSGGVNTLNGGTIYVYARTAPWTAIGSSVPPAVANVDFTGLSGYDELLCIIDAVTASAATNRRLQYSVNNGASFYAGATDYQREHTVAGVNSNWSEAQLCSADSAAALSLIHHLFNTTGGRKSGLSLGGREVDGAFNPGHYFKASASRIDALRATSGTAATLGGGGIYLYGRAKPWTVIASRNCVSAPAVNQDFTGLGGYEELLLVMDSVGASGNASRNFHVSTDNGASWHTSVGDYYTSYTTGGGKANGGGWGLSLQSSAGRSLIAHIPMTTGAQKPIFHTGNGRFINFVANSNRINGLRVTSDTAFTLNSGTIELFGR